MVEAGPQLLTRTRLEGEGPSAQEPALGLTGSEGRISPSPDQAGATEPNASIAERIARYGKCALALGVSALSLGGIAKPAEANASPAQISSMPNAAELPQGVTATFRTETGRASVEVSDVATGRVTILSNVRARGMSRAQRRRLERQGRCRTFDGREHEIWTWGLGPGGGTYGRDYRESRFCWVNGRWIRVDCRNPSKIDEGSPRDRVEGRVLFVRSFANAVVRVRAFARAVAQCRTDDGRSSADAEGVASATGRGRLRTFVRTRGNSAVRIYGRAYGRAEARARAQVHCESSESVVVQPAPQEQNEAPVITDITNIDHVTEGGTARLCARAIDNNGDAINFAFRTALSIVENGVEKRSQLTRVADNDPNVECVDVTAPDFADNQTRIERVTVTASDGHLHDEAFDEFEIVHRPGDNF